MTAFFIDEEGNKINRTKCQIFTRVMGYCRPVSNFNIGKRSEFYSRTYFTGDYCDSNLNFVRAYS